MGRGFGTYFGYLAGIIEEEGRRHYYLGKGFWGEALKEALKIIRVRESNKGLLLKGDNFLERIDF